MQSLVFRRHDSLPVLTVLLVVLIAISGTLARVTPVDRQSGARRVTIQCEGGTMELGCFSVSLAVKDIESSKLFYQKLGFTPFAGDQSQHWLILKNGEHAIGLFQGMFEGNILTFNPGWTSDAQPLPEFTDVRELQRQIKALGVEMVTEADEDSTGPASFVIVDPDGNTILVDQHV